MVRTRMRRGMRRHVRAFARTCARGARNVDSCRCTQLTAWHGPLLPPPVCVAAFEGRGNGLAAERRLAKGEVIFTEKALLAFGLSHVPHCHHCFRSLFPKHDPAIAGLPMVTELWPATDPHPCPHACGVIFCSAHCRDTAIASYHALLCSGSAADPIAADRLRRTCGDACGRRGGEAEDDRADCALDSLGAMRMLPGLVARAAAMVVSSARQNGSGLNRALQAICGGGEDRPAMACVPEHLLPVFDYFALGSLLERVLQLSCLEASWFWGRDSRDGSTAAAPAEALTDEQGHAAGEGRCKVLVLAGCMSANAIRARPACPFEGYMRNLRHAVPRLDARKELTARVLDACGAVCQAQALAPAAADGAMWEVCGVEAACVYGLQSKCNHACDANAEARTFTLPDSTIDLVAVREVPRGGEVVISYVDPSRPTRERRRRLLDTHGFSCACVRCVRGQHYSRTLGCWVPDDGLAGAGREGGGEGGGESLREEGGGGGEGAALGAEERGEGVIDLEALDALFDALNA